MIAPRVIRVALDYAVTWMQHHLLVIEFQRDVTIEDEYVVDRGRLMEAIGIYAGNIAGREGGKARGVHVADLAVKGDRLAVAVDQKYDTRRALDTKPCQNGLEPLKLMFL